MSPNESGVYRHSKAMWSAYRVSSFHCQCVVHKSIMQAAGRLSAYYDMVIDIFDEMNGFLRRLPVYTKQKTTEEFERILVDTLAQLLVTLGAVIKSLKNRYCREEYQRLPMRRINDIFSSTPQNTGWA